LQNQIYIFTVFILDGIIIGLLFDIFRILRKSFKTPDIITYCEDFIFWILTFLLILYSIFKFNNGELRLYIFIGLTVGILLYLLAFSRIFINISVTIISLIKKIINTILIVPIMYVTKLIRKVIFKPIVFISINIGRILSNLIEKLKFSKIKKKKSKKEKDFTAACWNILYRV